ncbi:MAG: S8 family serine peptidase, partial [Eggerthellaceae bacterium]
VLFVISAGNQHINLIPVEGGFEKLKDEDLERRSKHISEALMENRRNLKLLSPAESINSITVGATFEDNTAIEENALAVQPVEEGCVSPLTSFGGGIGRSIKPEILYPGGKFLVQRKTITASNTASIADSRAWNHCSRSNRRGNRKKLCRAGGNELLSGSGLS